MSETLPRQLSARVDKELIGSIRMLRRAGLSWSQMVKWGVALLADVYAAAWEHRIVPIGETPELKSFIYAKRKREQGTPPWHTEDTDTTTPKEQSS
ncbi:hypothetical protein SEA_BROPLEASE_66 [Streptomyces phage BroPlease]|nr:hypothetical protein SEA_BROPLEASE_66 [Streptomyces phage BroPlease]